MKRIEINLLRGESSVDRALAGPASVDEKRRAGLTKLLLLIEFGGSFAFDYDEISIMY
jgi:hypothetical protein